VLLPVVGGTQMERVSRGRVMRTQHMAEAAGASNRPFPVAPSGSSIDLYWLPLGAGGHFVRLNGGSTKRFTPFMTAVGPSICITPLLKSGYQMGGTS
jgi:hypothetical protein